MIPGFSVRRNAGCNTSPRYEVVFQAGTESEFVITPYATARVAQAVANLLNRIVEAYRQDSSDALSRESYWQQLYRIDELTTPLQ